jgi:hypothetical protein
MTPLTENIHFARIIIRPQAFVYDSDGSMLGYCAYVRDGQAVLLKRTHPDICEEDLLAEGERERMSILAEERRQARRRLAKSN